MLRETELIGGPLCGERRYWTDRFVEHVGGAYLRQETPTGAVYVWRTPTDLAADIERVCRALARDARHLHEQHEARADHALLRLLDDLFPRRGRDAR